MSWSARAAVRLALVAALLVAIGFGLARVRTDTTAASFLPSDDPTQVATLEAARSFGGDPVVVVAESARPAGLLEGDQILRLVGLEGTLSQLPDVSVVYGPGTVLNQVAGQARNLLAAISGRRDALMEQARRRAAAEGATSAEAERAARTAVRRFDQRYGRLLVQGLPAGLPTLRNPGFVNAVVFDGDGLPRQQWRFVVPAADAVAVIVRPREGLNQASTERLVEAVQNAVDAAGLDTKSVVITGTPVVAAGLADVLQKEMPLVGGLALGLTLLCYLLLPWVPRSFRRALPVLTTVVATAATLAVFGWLDHPVSLGVVAFLPILLGTGSDFPAYLVRGADRRTVVVTGLAAAAGFSTLILSPVPLVRDLGIALAAGVTLTLVFGLLVARWTRVSSADDDDQRPSDPRSERSLGGAQRTLLVAVAAGFAVTGWALLPGLELEADPQSLIEGSPATGDIERAAEVLGSSGEVQLLVRGDDVMTPEALRWMGQVEELIVRRYGDRLHPIVSPPALLAFLGDKPTAGQIHAGLDQVPDYLRSAVVRDDSRQAVLSFGTELKDVAAERALIKEIGRDVPEPPPGVTLEVAGLPVVAGRSYELLSEHRYLHAGIGIVAAGAVLLVGLRRRREAALAVVAAAMATGWGFLAAQVLGIALTPLTLALGSLATATACEFTVLLGAARQQTGLHRSVLVAATAAASGYVALAVSDLAVIRGFGLFLAATVGFSLLAAYVCRVVRRPIQLAGPTTDEPQDHHNDHELEVLV